ncbi:MAG: hypothetical protein RLZZ390_511 [Bacteroidota bacterium]
MHLQETEFDEKHVLHQLKHYLPTQTPIRDFIHHNTLHAFQDTNFFEAIFKASKIFGYQVTLELEDYRRLFLMGRISNEVLQNILSQNVGADEVQDWKYRMFHKAYDCNNEFRIGRLRSFWKANYHIDLDNLVHPLLFRILCSYLDQGISIVPFPNVSDGLIDAIKKLEQTSAVSFFQSDRARQLLISESFSITSLLNILVGDSKFYEEYLFDQQFSHHGWSGMVAVVEEEPHTLLYSKKVSLKDLILLELLLEIDQLDTVLGKRWKPLSSSVTITPKDLFSDIQPSELNDVLKYWQLAFEWSYYDQVLSGLNVVNQKPIETIDQVSFQAVFCIDERECSLRRHVESIDKRAETFGSPGFFGVEFYFLPSGGKFLEKLCPAPVTPKFLIKEFGAEPIHEKELFHTKKTLTIFSGLVYSILGGFLAGFKLFMNLFKPQMSPAISNAFAHMGEQTTLAVEANHPLVIENGLQVGFTVEEMAVRVQSVLQSIGMIDSFAPLVYLVAHGSSSANNPHHGAHDCGACSGRPGAVNARVFAQMANHVEVRKILNTKNIQIPETTQFIGAMHDTASDVIGFYDENILSKENLQFHLVYKQKFEMALDLNAKERSRRFASIDTKNDLATIRSAIKARSVSYFEPRPELGHGTNALCFVGRRSSIKGLFLDRRAFMNSYDYTIDPNGEILFNVIKPLPTVCGGINLEYYFSRVDNQKFGAGTKLPHNVMGLIGVANSSDGDLRPGLPLQMIEVHDPVRLLMIVEHFPEVVLNTINQNKALFEWFEMEWVHLIAMHPLTKEFYYFRKNKFERYTPQQVAIPTIDDFQNFVENALEMETNHILHATQENLSVHLLK